MNIGDKNIEVSAIIAKVRELAESNPDTTVSCQYTYAYDDDEGHKAGEPCCIVGSALAGLGVDPMWFLENEEAVVIARNNRGIQVWLEEQGLMTDKGEWLNSVQMAQDSGATWRDAVKEANRHHSSV